MRKLLDERGKVVGLVRENWRDVFDKATNVVITLSEAKRLLRSALWHVDIRNEKLEKVRSHEVDEDARYLVAVDWPEPGDIVYATTSEAVVLKPDGTSTNRMSLGATNVRSVSGVVFHDGIGEEYLGLCASRRPGKGGSVLVVFSKTHTRVYEEQLPPSRAISTLGTTDRFYVGVGMKGVVEYRLRKEKH